MSENIPNNKVNRPEALIFLMISAFLILLDQWTKFLAVRYVKPVLHVGLIPHVLEFRYLENRGAAFGMLQNRQWVFVIFAFVVVFGCIYAFSRLPAGKYTALKLCLAALSAGAAGNLIDRVTRGYVVDFIYFSGIRFPIFNVADICVSVSVVVLLILVLFGYKDETQAGEM